MLLPAQTPISRGARGLETSRKRTPAAYQPSATTLLALTVNQWLLHSDDSGPLSSAPSGASYSESGTRRLRARSIRQTWSEPSW